MSLLAAVALTYSMFLHESLASTFVCGSADMRSGPVVNWTGCSRATRTSSQCGAGSVLFQCDRYNIEPAPHHPHGRRPAEPPANITLPPEIISSLLCKEGCLNGESSPLRGFDDVINLALQVQEAMPPSGSGINGPPAGLNEKIQELPQLFASLVMANASSPPFELSRETVSLLESITGMQHCPNDPSDIMRASTQLIQIFGSGMTGMGQYQRWMEKMLEELGTYAAVAGPEAVDNLSRLRAQYTRIMEQINSLSPQGGVQLQSSDTPAPTQDTNELSSCLAKLIENELGLNLPSQEARTLFLALFHGPHAVPFQGIKPLLQACRSQLQNPQSFVACALTRAGYQNVDANLAWSREHQIVSFDASTEALAFYAARLEQMGAVGAPGSALHSMEMIVPGDPDFYGAVFNQPQSGHPGTMLSNIESQIRSGITRITAMNWCDSTPESSHAVAEFAHRQTENGIIHETGHAVYFRLVERMSATTPASRQLRDQWDAFSWNPRTGNQDTMGSPTHSSRIPIPRSCVRNPAPRVAPPVTSCTTAGLQTRMNSDSREADARSAGFVSIHAAINNVEDFAEAYAQYFTGLRPITDSPEGRAILRRKFAFIESLIGVPRPAGLPNP